jgi:phage shock protein E
MHLFFHGFLAVQGRACYHKMEKVRCCDIMVPKIDPAQAIRLLDAGAAIAVDVREPDEYASGHIPGAVLLPLGKVQTKAAALLPDKTAHLLVYCRTGRRSESACIQLASMGYTRLENLGGILRWPYELEN